MMEVQLLLGSATMAAIEDGTPEPAEIPDLARILRGEKNPWG